MSKGNNRKLKVYYGHGHNYKRHPVIHLSGRYLARNGFKVGDELSVALEENRIVISKVLKAQPQST